MCRVPVEVPMFGYDQATPYDVKFRFFGIPVRVNPFFWLIMALLGEWAYRADGPGYLLLWIACGFFSILLHEFGHAFFIRWFGSSTAIVLHGFGGYAINPDPPSSPWKRILISAAGPGAQLLLVALLFVSNEATGWASVSHLNSRLFAYLFLMNLFWAIFNLLPIFPMDGGMIFREIYVLARLRNADAAIYLTSMIVAGLLALRGITGILNVQLKVIDEILPSWLRPGMMMTMWFVLYVIMNYQLWQQAQQRRRYYDDPYDDTPPWRG
jgi:Zn-dependent protease